MLKNIHRLRKSREIQRVFQKGKQTRSQNFIIRYLPSRNQVSRFAFVVGTKVDKRATRRNALKRQMREVVRKNLEKVPAGFDIIIIGNKIPNWPIEQKKIVDELGKLLLSLH
ncbi:MAG: ribonuclease P protein component [Candidatus Berkelbacteria bacterium Athens1014_28]|uniref:Ribonuclease P protein component n=1 Tax=Candidatus Berkelbacteria bacterium Athens1014_28 TaxID=2017145 RepID=A0A554LKH8_9BACT|nr:MAG: ribonuclease P protein component [Candidatus Berkelbacteria bacterium Athens1014_28]